MSTDFFFPQFEIDVILLIRYNFCVFVLKKKQLLKC